MKQFLLATVLIGLPVAAFAAIEVWALPGSTATAAQTTKADPLGDLSAYETIVSDTGVIAGTGDLVAAEKRITDFETKWDNAEATMRPMDPNAWGNVDHAADAALSTLRSRHPDAKDVKDTLADLSTALGNPSGGASAGSPQQNVAGIAVTDANGHALPCETMLGDLRSKLASSTADAKTSVTDLQAKATERCNADDDTRADAFAAQAIALLAK